MAKLTIIDYVLNFTSLSTLDGIEKLVIHHTGNPVDDDLSAKEIHRSHLNQGWSGIGYHFVIRKDGSVERGRPEWAVGSHAYGYNRTTLGIHVCGNFEIVSPTPEQIESCAILVNVLTQKYGLKNTAKYVVGHRDLMATACPGKYLYAQLQTIRGKAEYYRLN